ncbi:MAG: threonylcarbamoyl-AMP synthase [Acholeplasmatales bacterium]|nr:threonylcarbamoyl-AMP synthase [Acholeplasmatales bacterium]
MSKVIIFPTDTVYGIGTPIFDLEGIEKIYEIKKRPKNKPLACLCSSIEQIKSIAKVSVWEQKIIDELFPGALTIILNSCDEVKDKIGYDTIAVRIPNYDLARSILDNYGPMLTTSVNDSGSVPLNEYNEIKEKYEDLVSYVYPTSISSSNVPSTIIKLDNKEVKIIREGEIKLKDILNALEK